MARKKKESTAKNGVIEGLKLKQKTNLSAKSDNQIELFKSIKNNVITFVSGPAGSGKTKISVVQALDSLIKCKVGKIYFTRPCVEAEGENLGFMPGDLNEKISPYMLPIFSFLSEYLESSQIEKLVKEHMIETLPLAFMRGVNFENSFVLLDEAQNTTPAQMRMFLTRISHNSKIVITGDPMQSDIFGENGLNDALMRHKGDKDIGFVKFTKEDIMRHPIVARIEDRYNMND